MPHIRAISDSETVLTISGVKGVKIADINEILKKLDEKAGDISYQLFDASRIAGVNHLYYAAANAENAMIKGYNISNNLNIETLLYAACENQISKAIKVLGVSHSSDKVALVVFSDEEENELANTLVSCIGTEDDSVLEITQEKYGALVKTYDVSEKAIEAIGREKTVVLTSLIAEKGALLGLRR